jgi:MFS family permease
MAFIDEDILSDKASGIYNMFYSLGAILAPIIGGILGDAINFRPTNDLMAVLSATCMVVFIVFNTSCQSFRC